MNTLNKLFIIGNGFDLSLGLKTSYEDFIFWLVKKETLKAVEKSRNKYGTGNSNNELFTVLISNNIRERSNDILNDSENLKHLKSVLSENNIDFKIEYNDEESFFKKIYTNISKKWVDIELEYFNLIKFQSKLINEELEKRNPNHSKSNETIEFYKFKVEAYNKELEYLGKYLKEYLIDISKTPIDQKMKIRHLNHFESEAKSYYFLNFNYTNTLETVLTNFKRPYQINHIHGTINKKSLIFGYGDEMDKSYKAIEELNDNTFFKHIKSFRYFKHDNYSKLLSFLSSGKFQVCIYGHSCGLSDRVMLNEIFEHENCESIEVYYYNEDEYTTKTMDISRHFNSNQLMRQRIQFFKPENRIPQVDDK